MTEPSFAPARRMTLWIPGTGPAHDPERGHLFIILTDSCSAGMNLLVPVCSAGSKPDTTCLLGAGDHPFLKRKSFVAYHLLKTYLTVSLVEQEKRKLIRPMGLLEAKLFAIVCNGVEASRYSAPKYKRYFAEQTRA